MGTTVIGQPSTAFPLTHYPAVIEIKRNWFDGWSYAPDLEFIHCGLYASSSAVSQLQFKRRFGDRKMPYEAAFSQVSGVDMDGWWARLSLTGDIGTVVQHVGIIEASATQMQGSTVVQAGEQTFVAYGGLRILQKVEMGTAFFLHPNEAPSRVEWVPSMNARDRRHVLVGNAADAGDGSSTKIYGGAGVWTHFDYLEYVLLRFVQQDGGPKWTVGGQADILKKMKTTIDFGNVTRIADVLRELIPVKYGVDYFVAPTADGFEIRVFSLSDRNQAFAGVTLPSNPDTIAVVRSQQPEMMEIRVVESSEKRVDKIVVQGRRITVCGSLRGSSGGHGTETGGQSLVKRWTPALEAVYKGADGLVSSMPGLSGARYDEARAREKFADVYQHLGAPNNWDMDQGAWSVACRDDGTIYTDAPFQTAQRETLGWIPLKVGFDYSTNPETDNTDMVLEPDRQFPLVWLIDETLALPDPTGGYFQANLHGIHVSHPYHDWGVVLQASPNHLLALNSWSNTDNGTSAAIPLFDYNTAIATIAIESDHRIHLGYTVPSNLAAGDGSVMTITDEGAELWVLLPGTVVAQRAEDGFPLTSGETLRTVRNDINRLGLIACGVIARYIFGRFRVQIDWKGHAPWGNLLGHMLTEIRGGSYWQQFACPLTSIEWTAGQTPTTVVKFGYA